MKNYFRSTIAIMATIALLVQACGENKNSNDVKAAGPRGGAPAVDPNAKASALQIVTDKISLDLGEKEKVDISVVKSVLTPIDANGILKAAVTLDINGTSVDILATHDFFEAKPAVEVKPANSASAAVSGAIITDSASSTVSGVAISDSASGTVAATTLTQSASGAISQDQAKASDTAAKNAKPDVREFRTKITPTNLNYTLDIIGFVDKDFSNVYYMAIRITSNGKTDAASNRGFVVVFGKSTQITDGKARLALDNLNVESPNSQSAGPLGPIGLINYMRLQFPADNSKR